MDFKKKRPVNVEIGEFPFPVINGPQESRYLTWLRNHSNYMVESGVKDYLRIAAVLVRGIVINFLIMLPYFLVLAVILAQFHLYLSQPQSVEFSFDDPPAQGGGGAFRTEQLTVTVTSNFGETDTHTTEFDRGENAIKRSMNTLVEELIFSPGQFRTLSWQADCVRDSRDIGCLVDRGGNETIVIKATDTEAKTFVTFTEDELLDGDTVKELTSRSTLHFSTYMLAFAALCIVAYPVAMRMGRVKRYQNSLRTGHLSSVKRRDRFERAFGTLLFLIIAVGVLESFPRLSVFFNTLRQGDVAIAFPTLATMVGGIVAANQVLPMLGGLAQKIAVFVVGLLGLMIPLVVILFVVEFLVYTDKSAISVDTWDFYFLISLVLMPAIFALLLFATWIIGLRSFKARGHVQLISLFLSMVALVFAVIYSTDWINEFYPQHLFSFYVLLVALELGVYCWLAVDVNQTSINGLYRDRLASAYLIGVDTTGDIDIEQDINLQEICNYDAGSTSPYHLINVALNLQATTDIGVRDRNSDFFIFSKRFTGSHRTGYCRSENMEAVYPQMDLGTAMAVSAAAAAPNMGRATNPLMVAFLTLLNIRLGFWVPHPDRLEKYLAEKKYIEGAHRHHDFHGGVFPEELEEIAKRRAQAYGDKTTRRLDLQGAVPSTRHGLIGLAFSGGGIRSATINLGIAQELHRRGVFDHVDYLSTVSGGGYIGASISTLMRHKTSPYAEIGGKVVLPESAETEIVIQPDDPDIPPQHCVYANQAELDPDVLIPGARVQAGQRLLKRIGRDGRDRFVSLMDGFSWRVRPSALRHEMLSKLDEDHAWINLSDGGHIENMACIELLRRRCRVIFIGDGEADPKLHFSGLATLLRYARIDLGVDIDINVDDIRLRGKRNCSGAHYAVGRINYPPDPKRGIDQEETGYLIYLKSSFTNDEDEVIKEYRDRNPAFPHESTADQMFDEGQFEAYRALGQHIVASALPKVDHKAGPRLDFDALEAWIQDQDLPPPSHFSQLLAPPAEVPRMPEREAQSAEQN